MFDFGIRLQQLRMSRNMSQAALGKKINRSKSVICAYENNLRIPPLEVLTDIAVFFNVSLDYLVGIDKEEMVSFVTVFYSSAVVYLRVGTSLAYQNGRGLLTHSKQTNPLANHSKK